MADVEQERVIGAVKALILERKTFISDVRSYLESIAVIISEEEIEHIITRFFHSESNALMKLDQALLLSNTVQGIWHDEYSFLVGRRSYKLYENASDAKFVYMLYSCVGGAVERAIDAYESPDAVLQALESRHATVDCWVPLSHERSESLLGSMKTTMRITVTLS